MNLHAAATRLVRRYALDDEDATELLQMLGLVEPVRVAVPVREVPAHARHGRSSYVPGCKACADVNAAYVRRWRLGAGVTKRRVFVRLQRVPQPLRADSRRRACSEQLSMEVSA